MQALYGIFQDAQPRKQIGMNSIFFQTQQNFLYDWKKKRIVIYFIKVY